MSKATASPGQILDFLRIRARDRSTTFTPLDLAVLEIRPDSRGPRDEFRLSECGMALFHQQVVKRLGVDK